MHDIWVQKLWTYEKWIPHDFHYQILHIVRCKVCEVGPRQVLWQVWSQIWQSGWTPTCDPPDQHCFDHTSYIEYIYIYIYKGLEGCKNKVCQHFFIFFGNFILSKFTSIIHSTKLKWKSYLKINKTSIQVSWQIDLVFWPNNVGQFLMEG
jgi:hypothetical protein